MVYSFALIKHANIRYRESVSRLARYELLALLRSLSIDCDVQCEEAGGAVFLSFESRPLSGDEISYLFRHSSISFMAEKAGDSLLRPLNPLSSAYLPEDLPEVLKYKGKTSVSFTFMMLNIALSLTPFVHSDVPLTVLDPLCGKGTTCFCALQRGFNAIGLDQDHKAVREAGDYFTRYLKFHQLKHSVEQRSETFEKNSVPLTCFTFANTREHYLQHDTRSLVLACGDTASSPAIVRRKPAHLIIADLPYGIQHAPQFGRKPESFTGLLSRALPVWQKALAPGGALALSFNTLTLPVDTASTLIRNSGLQLCEGELFSHFRHEVEQAVVRDVLFAVKTP
ncbi:MAG: hypothetical protein IJK06_06395 [Clostridia bacterium]|nr:hypothetical protein [Clostridia bacterium]